MATNAEIAAWNAAFYEVWSGRFIPKIRAVTPRRSGKLVDSIKPGFANGRFYVNVDRRGFYWHFQRGLLDEYLRILNQEFPAMVAYANNRSGITVDARIVTR